MFDQSNYVYDIVHILVSQTESNQTDRANAVSG